MPNGPSKQRGRPAANDSLDILAYITPDVNRGVPVSKVTDRPLLILQYDPRASKGAEPTLVVERKISGPTLARRARKAVREQQEEFARQSELAARPGTRFIGISPPRPPLSFTPIIAEPGRPKNIRRRST